MQWLAILGEHLQGSQILRLKIHPQLLADQVGAARQLFAGVAHMHEGDVGPLAAAHVAVHQAIGWIVQQLQTIAQGFWHVAQADRGPPYPIHLLAHSL